MGQYVWHRNCMLLAMDKNDGDNLPERTRISRETDGKNGGRDDNLVEKKEEAGAALDNQPPGVPWLLVLCLLSMLAWAGYALSGL
ncbi:MAG: hypothetical protein E5X67_36105 [Mesorhizobium sp.]|nr:MAG: hypothetical protein E5X67_36105 [Mesorhizobium sp.]